MTHIEITRPMTGAASHSRAPVDQETDWLPLLVIRPDDDADHVCFSDPLHGYRATVRLDALLDLLTGAPGENAAAQRLAEALRDRGWLPAQHLDPSVRAGLAQWRDRGWHPSL